MTITHWLTILTFVCGLGFSVLWYWWRRRTTRLEALEAAVFGAEGVRNHFTKYVLQDDFRRQMAAFQESLRGVSEEGQRREDRILKAIQHNTTAMGVEVRELKADLRGQVGELKNDVRAQTQRVDEVLLLYHPQR